MITKTDLINVVSEAVEGLTKKDAGVAVNAVFDAMVNELKAGEKVSVHGFGTFDVKERAARKGRNPQTGAEIEIPARKAPAFKAAKSLKAVVNGEEA